MESVLEDRSPPHMNKKQGLAMIEFATKEPYSFLHINMRKPFETRYTRNLDQTINYTLQNTNQKPKCQASETRSVKDGSPRKS